MAFDAPSREECTASRPRSNTPLQSLVLLNDPIYVEAARSLAARVLKRSADPQGRLELAFDLVLQRAPRPQERELMQALLQRHLQHYREDSQAAAAVLTNGVAVADEDLDRAELAAWTSVSRVLLSLYETISRS